MRRASRWRWVLAVAALVAGACTDGGGEETPATKATIAAPTDADSDGDDVDAEVTGWAGELRLGLAGVHSLDPALASPASVSDTMLLDLLYDPLVELDETGVVHPALASPSVNADLTVWRFEIDRSATFADGRPVTAADVVASLNHIRDERTSYAALQLDNVESVSALGVELVEIRLREPSALLPELLSSPFFGIAPTDAHGPDADASHPATSGDYEATAVTESELELSRRSGTGPASIRVRLFATESEAFDAFLAGELDWSPVPLTRYGEALDEVGDAALVPFDGTVMLGVNRAVPPLERDALREAVALAIDRETLAAAVFGPAAQALNGLVPAGVVGATDACLDPCGPDPAAARSLVDETGFGGASVPLRLLTDLSETQRAIAGVLEEQLAAADIDLQVTALDATTTDQLIAGGQQQLFLFSTLGLARSPSVHLRSLYASGSPDNLLRYDNPDVDERIEATRSEPLPALRLSGWREIEAAVLADVPVVPLAQLRTVAVQSPTISGLVVRADGSLDLSALTGSG